MYEQTRAILLLSALVGASLVGGCLIFGGDSVKECDVCDAVYCDNNRVVTCECREASPDGGTDRILRVLEDCSGAALTCGVVEETSGQRWEDEWEPGVAACFDECTVPNEASCRGVAGDEVWHVCASVEAPSTPELRDLVVTWVQSGEPVSHVEPEGSGAFPGSGSAPPSTDVSLAWASAGIACEPCQSTCACAPSNLCVEGYCLSSDSGEEPVCCGRERGTACPNGTACELADGTAATCSTVARCGPCATNADCQTGECVDTGAEGTPVCLEVDEGLTTALQCRGSRDEVWRTDACGGWVALEDACGAGFRCEDAVCVESIPEIEVSPTLLDFGTVTLGTSADLSLRIGNVGSRALEVSEMTVDPDVEGFFDVSPASTTVGIDEIVTITVTFEPVDDAQVNARLYIRSDDPDEAEVTVLMNGRGTP